MLLSYQIFVNLSRDFLKFLSDCQVQTSFSFISLLITLRALSLLTSSSTARISRLTSQMPHVGYTAEGVPLGLMAHSLKVLHLNLRGFTAYQPYCLERVNTPWVLGFSFPYCVFIIAQGFEVVKYFFYFFCESF